MAAKKPPAKKPPAKKPPAKKPPAKPRRVTMQAKLKNVLEHLAGGMSLRAACKMPNTPDLTTLLKRVKEDQEFSQQYARAREAGYALLAEDIIELSSQPQTFEEVTMDADGNVISRRVIDNHQRTRQAIDARKWMLSKMLPKVYGDKTENTHRFEDAKDITVTFVEAPARPRAKLINGQYIDVTPEEEN